METPLPELPEAIAGWSGGKKLLAQLILARGIDLSRTPAPEVLDELVTAARLARGTVNSCLGDMRLLLGIERKWDVKTPRRPHPSWEQSKRRQLGRVLQELQIDPQYTVSLDQRQKIAEALGCSAAIAGNYLCLHRRELNIRVQPRPRAEP